MAALLMDTTVPSGFIAAPSLELDPGFTALRTSTDTSITVSTPSMGTVAAGRNMARKVRNAELIQKGSRGMKFAMDVATETGTATGAETSAKDQSQELSRHRILSGA